MNNIARNIILVLVGLIISNENFAQFQFIIDKVEIANVNIQDEKELIIDDGVIGPRIYLEGYVKNDSDSSFMIITYNSEFYMQYVYKGIEFKKELILLSFGGLKDTLFFQSGEAYRFYLENNAAFVNSFYSPSKKDYFKEIDEVIPTLRFYYQNTFYTMDNIKRFSIIKSQNLRVENIQIVYCHD